ncbi:MAG: 50S ribosomal protein L3 [Nanoarchaeota archaeon]|nr:50S ribosomal protein L3 [Nanoarchaeota archaeon]
MPKINHPRLGSLQYWPRKRSKHSLARVRSWANESKVKPLGFIGYKAGMTHLHILDNRPRSLTKGEEIFFPATIIDCPPMTVYGLAFYKKSIYGVRKISSIWAANVTKELGRKIQLPKKNKKTLDAITDFDDLRLLVQSNPKLTSVGTKRPKLMEITIGGSKDEKMSYAKNVLGKEIEVKDVFENGNQLDVHGVSIGKGFQGTIKRFGAHIRQHKAEKVKRGIGTLGPWHPNRVRFSVPQSGKMGYHLRTEYNKQLLKIGNDSSDITPKSGFNHYGLIKNTYVLIKGSVIGPKKRAVLLTQAIRPNKKLIKEAPQITHLSVQH